MIRFKRIAALCVLGLALPASVAADGESGWSYDENLAFRSQDDRFQMDLVNVVHATLTAANPELGESGESFDLSKLRVRLSGKAFDHWRFGIETDLATGSLSDDQDDSELLLDAYVVYARKRLAQLWVGQGVVPYGRQFQTFVDHQQFIDRSIATQRFAHGRDVGVAVVGENEGGTYGYSVGLYNGNGINQARDENRNYLAAARLVITPLGPMRMTESDPDWTKNPEPRLAVGVSAMTNKTGAGTFEEERINGGNFEFAFRVRGLAINAEFFTESLDPLLGIPVDETDTDGWYLQAGYTFPISEIGMMEIAGRYSEILFDVADADETEAGIVVTLFLRGQRAKVQVDYRQLEFEGLQFGDQIDRDEARALLQLIF